MFYYFNVWVSGLCEEATAPAERSHAYTGRTCKMHTESPPNVRLKAHSALSHPENQPWWKMPEEWVRMCDDVWNEERHTSLFRRKCKIHVSNEQPRVSPVSELPGKFHPWGLGSSSSGKITLCDVTEGRHLPQVNRSDLGSAVWHRQVFGKSNKSISFSGKVKPNTIYIQYM